MEVTLCIYKLLSGCTFNLWETLNHILNHSIDFIIISDLLYFISFRIFHILVIGLLVKSHISVPLLISKGDSMVRNS